MGIIYIAAEAAARKHQTRDPYRLLNAIGAITKFSDEYEKGGLKGFSAILNNQMFAVINAKLSENDMRIVAGHEAAHLILHKQEILRSPAKALKDLNLFDNSGRLEYQANSFLADFLVSDKDVMELITNNDLNYFGAARELAMPPHLLAFKVYRMVHRGYKIHSPMDFRSDFLGDSDIWEG